MRARARVCMCVCVCVCVCVRACARVPSCGVVEGVWELGMVHRLSRDVDVAAK